MQSVDSILISSLPSRASEEDCFIIIRLAVIAFVDVRFFLSGVIDGFLIGIHVSRLKSVYSKLVRQMTPSDTLCRRQLANYLIMIHSSLSQPHVKIQIAQCQPDVATLRFFSSFSSPDVIYLPANRRDCISLKFTCEKRVSRADCKCETCNYKLFENRFNFFFDEGCYLTCSAVMRFPVSFENSYLQIMHSRTFEEADDDDCMANDNHNNYSFRKYNRKMLTIESLGFLSLCNRFRISM